jgi:hypothetical protein
MYIPKHEKTLSIVRRIRANLNNWTDPPESIPFPAKYAGALDTWTNRQRHAAKLRRLAYYEARAAREILEYMAGGAGGKRLRSPESRRRYSDAARRRWSADDPRRAVLAKTQAKAAAVRARIRPSQADPNPKS